MRIRKFYIVVALAVSIPTAVVFFSSRTSIGSIRKKTTGPDLKPVFHAGEAELLRKSFAYNVSSRNIFYNRVGKCGSRTLLNIMSRLAKRNNFTYARSTNYKVARPKPSLVLEEIKKITALKPPTFYNRHIHYLDFRKYNLEQPIYINMIRDPIARFSSEYNYMKYGDGMGTIQNPRIGWGDINDCIMQGTGLCNKTNYMFYTGMYFCGFDDDCTKSKSGRVKTAKKHIDEEYSAIGMLEEFENTLRLFEKMLPRYFEGALEDWELHKLVKRNYSTKKYDILTEESTNKLKIVMADEIEVYNHAKAKFEYLKTQFRIL